MPLSHRPYVLLGWTLGHRLAALVPVMVLTTERDKNT